MNNKTIHDHINNDMNEIDNPNTKYSFFVKGFDNDSILKLKSLQILYN
jgi:hypothetical protein